MHFGNRFHEGVTIDIGFDQKPLIIPDNQIKQLPNFSEQFNLFTDASGVGIGAVLQQNQKPIAFASRTLNKAERNYTVTERECLAVIWALNKLKTYFGPLPGKVITDHAALIKLTNGKNLSSRMIRWTLKLSEFNIEWEHRPGVQNVDADLLSRNPVDSVEGSQISCAALRALAINSREQFIREQREDPEFGHIYRYLGNPDDASVNATVCEARYGAPISLISVNGPKFMTYVFEHLSHRLDIKHMKTVTYRPQANLTERVNRNLVQMIASFVEENHENWDQFLHEFAFALRKLINVTEDTKYVGRNIERLFDEARRNMQKKHKSWEKYYNRIRRDVGKFMPKFEGLYRVLEVKGNNLIIWKSGRSVTVNIDQFRVYLHRQTDTISSKSQVETLYDAQGVSHRSNRSNQG
ncbi:retrovirus-related Pol polyprotein from transposon opus [Trichonephila clavipes]|nr:retrovirus-related Pol polyprotein from transposon opus [Trichonephila clavipes]